MRDWFGTEVTAYPVAGGASAFAVISRKGDVLYCDGDLRDERIVDGPLGLMETISFYDERFYAIGGAGCQFYREGERRWLPLSEDSYDQEYLRLGIIVRSMRLGGYKTREEFRAKSAEETTKSIMAYARYESPYYGFGGLGPDDLYFGGQNGALMHFDGAGFHDLDSGVRSTLTQVRVHKGEVYISGAHRGSVILKGNARDGFRPIFERPMKELYINSMVFRGDDILIADSRKGGWRSLSAAGRRALPRHGRPASDLPGRCRR